MMLLTKSMLLPLIGLGAIIEKSENLRQNRLKVMDIFVADYPQGLEQGRYLAASLPNLPFVNGEFDLALCSHLLFLYSDLLSLEFHQQSIKELCRVAKEVRIFPLLTLARKESPFLAIVRENMNVLRLKSRIETVNYELQKGGNQMLRLLAFSS